LEFQRYKLRNRLDGGPIINNRLFDKAKHIINEYGVKSTERIFSFIPDPTLDYNAYTNFLRNINHSLKRVSETLKLHVALKSKSTRYIFRTHAAEKLIHNIIVEKLQGHTNDAQSYAYLGIINNKVQDAEHLKIIDF